MLVIAKGAVTYARPSTCATCVPLLQGFQGVLSFKKFD
jgi:hypothetical protein